MGWYASGCNGDLLKMWRNAGLMEPGQTISTQEQLERARLIREADRRGTV